MQLTLQIRHLLCLIILDTFIPSKLLRVKPNSRPLPWSPEVTSMLKAIMISSWAKNVTGGVIIFRFITSAGNGLSRIRFCTSDHFSLIEHYISFTLV